MLSLPRMRAAPDTRRIYLYLALLTVIAMVSRLPQLFSPHVLLDGDESILGLMAIHVSGGREFPIFFYGQNYGLAVVEALAGACVFKLGGTGALQLKLSMLGIWIVGVVCCFLALSRVVGTTRSFWITLVLVLMPAWGVSSMKAWSGYLTAFAAAGGLFNLLVRQWDRPRASAWFASGVLTGIIFLAQPVWLPGVLPFVAFLLFAHRRVASGGLFLTGLAAVTVLVSTVSVGSVHDYWKRPALGNQDLVGSLPYVFEQVYVNLTGSYNLAVSVDPGPATALAARVWCGILIAAPLVQIYRLATGRYFLWSHLFFISMAATLVANWVLLDARDARYLLPLGALLVLWAGLEVCDLADRSSASARIGVVAAAAVITLGALSMIEFRNFSFTGRPLPVGRTEARSIDAVLRHLQTAGARHVFSLHPLLQWQLMFYSREHVVARWTSPADRYPAYVSEVDRAFHAGEPVALVGYVGAPSGLETTVPNPRTIYTVDNRYFVYVGPDKPVLDRLGVRFAD
jgi:hypothetical protein